MIAGRAAILASLVGYAAATLWATGKPFLVGFDGGCPYTGDLSNPQAVTLKTDVQSSPCTAFTLSNKTGSFSFSFTGTCDMDTNTASAAIFSGTSCSGASVLSVSGPPAPQCFASPALASLSVQSFEIDCFSTATSSTTGTLIGFIVILSLCLAGLVAYWVWQDRVAKKKVVDTTGTVAHYQALEEAEKAGH